MADDVIPIRTLPPISGGSNGGPAFQPTGFQPGAFQQDEAPEPDELAGGRQLCAIP